MSDRPDIHRLIAFQKVLVSFSNVRRASYLPDGRNENDVEHSYFLAMGVWFLAPHFPELNADKMLLLALAHDLVEVHSGDTFVYGDQKHIDSKPEREQAALEKLEQEWADFPEMTAAIREYAERQTPEAQFVYALDKLLPPMINYLAGGKVWQEHGVTLEMFRAEKEKKIPADSPVYPYYQEILAFLKSQPELFGKPSQQG